VIWSIRRGQVVAVVPPLFAVLTLFVSTNGYALSPTGHVVVLFETNSAEIKLSPHPSILQALADWSHGGPTAGLLVECYADRVGSDAYNMVLSERRCETVQAALMAGGVPSDRIETHAFGESEFQRTEDNVSDQANRVANISIKWD
jgi:outer membrane protein OmpA-like peptidoglycan-associated protein